MITSIWIYRAYVESFYVQNMHLIVFFVQIDQDLVNQTR